MVAAAGMMALWTGAALACPFCATAKTGNGYLLATVLLLAIPFLALGGFVLWLRHGARSQGVNRGTEENQSVP